MAAEATTADIVTAVANVFLALGAVLTAAWAAYTYREGKKAEAARWQKHVFDDLFLSGNFDKVRESLEFEYRDRLAKVLELSMLGCDQNLGEADRKLLIELDNFLNLVEYVLYLEQDKHQIDAEDRQALLGYWLGLITDPSRSAIRFYVSHYGYERITSLAQAKADIYVVLYGSLRRGQPQFRELGLDSALEFVGNCEFPAVLHDFGEYPGAADGQGTVKAEVYKVIDSGIFKKLDEYEEFDNRNLSKSLFVRRCVNIPRVGDAWVYMYNKPVDGAPIIESGDWLAHRQSRN